jgi:hypothetical protein
VVVLVEFFHYGFGMLAHGFLCLIVHELGIGLHHLHPNGLLQLAGFISLCEGFLGVAPSLSHFCRLFVAEDWRMNPGNAMLAHVRWVTMAVRPDLAQDYPRFQLAGLVLG